MTADLESQTNSTKNGPFTLISDAFAPVAEDLATLHDALIELLPTETQTARQIAEHVFSSGGKRVRPALYFLSTNLFGYKGEHRLPMAAVCEYVHTASLLHDDVVDNSTLRRNKPTANTLWGDEAAVLVGDLIYATASQLMAKTGHLEIVSSFARSISKMSEGELLQLEHICSPQMNENTYFKILEGKTATLIGTACKAAGLLAGASSEEISAIETFGSQIGLSFQLLDDALDFVSSKDIFGKKINADLHEGKITLPVLLLKDLMSSAENDVLRAIFKKPSLEIDDIATINRFVTHYRTEWLTIEYAEELTKKALDGLTRVFPPSKERSDIENLAECLLVRPF